MNSETTKKRPREEGEEEVPITETRSPKRQCVKTDLRMDCDNKATKKRPREEGEEEDVSTPKSPKRQCVNADEKATRVRKQKPKGKSWSGRDDHTMLLRSGREREQFRALVWGFHRPMMIRFEGTHNFRLDRPPVKTSEDLLPDMAHLPYVVVRDRRFIRGHVNGRPCEMLVNPGETKVYMEHRLATTLKLHDMAEQSPRKIRLIVYNVPEPWGHRNPPPDYMGRLMWVPQFPKEAICVVPTRVVRNLRVKFDSKFPELNIPCCHILPEELDGELSVDDEPRLCLPLGFLTGNGCIQTCHRARGRLYVRETRELSVAETEAEVGFHIIKEGQSRPHFVQLNTRYLDVRASRQQINHLKANSINLPRYLGLCMEEGKYVEEEIEFYRSAPSLHMVTLGNGFLGKHSAVVDYGEMNLFLRIDCEYYKIRLASVHCNRIPQTALEVNRRHSITAEALTRPGARRPSFHRIFRLFAGPRTCSCYRFSCYGRFCDHGYHYYDYNDQYGRNVAAYPSSAPSSSNLPTGLQQFKSFPLE